MRDYIKKDKFWEEINSFNPKHSITILEVSCAASRAFVDAVEVVRCKDCKYNCDGECSGPFIIGPHDECIVVSDDDFCSFGERKK